MRGAPPPDKKLLEYYFAFACIWAFGGCMLVDKVRGASELAAALVCSCTLAGLLRLLSSAVLRAAAARALHSTSCQAVWC